MRVLLIHPNYHSGGAEIAGNWPPAWAAYLTGYLKAGGYTDVHFVDAMTLHLDEAAVRAQIEAIKPDLVGCTAITPAIYEAERVLQWTKDINPAIVTVLGGIHGTFMYPQVLAEAPWIDAVVRGEGEAVLLNLVRAIDDGSWARDRHSVRGIAFLEDQASTEKKVVATPAEPSIKDLDTIKPDWGILKWDHYIYIPMNTRVAIPNFARGCPFTCTFCSQWKFWRDYRIRDPIKVVDEIEDLVKNHLVGFFILADEEPTIHRKKFIAFCEELIKRDLGILWGINTRVTDILRDEKLLPMFRKAGLIHVSLGTEAAAQLQLDRFNKETTIAQNKKAIQLLRDAGIVTEAQFIVGLENETAETLEETYRMARDWNPDMANWAMYTPWPFSDLFQELGDKVEVFDFAKYNFVTPIMKPDAMERSELLDRVMNNYRRFFMNKSFFQYPWEKDKLRRKYLMGCLKAFLKSGFQRTFYDLGRVGYWGPQSKKKVDFAFDTTRQYTRPSSEAIAEADAGWVTMHGPKIEHKRRQGELSAAMACGGGKGQLDEEVDVDAILAAHAMSLPAAHAADKARAAHAADAVVTPAAACGRGHEGGRPPASALRRRRTQGIAMSAATGAAGRIGPNAIIRVAEVLPAVLGAAGTQALFEAAGLAAYLRTPPQDMVDEAEVARLHAVLRQQLGGMVAGQVARRAGERTADYLLAQRIPKPVQALLKVLPAPMAARVLLVAIRRNAWTFAGSGAFTARAGRPCMLTIHRNPLCRDVVSDTPACDFYSATFERLFQVLVHPRSQAVETACEARGDPVCHFDLRW